MLRFRYLDIQDLSYRSMDELTAMLSVAYGDLPGVEDHSIDQIRILIGIRKITEEISARTWKLQQPEPPTLGR